MTIPKRGLYEVLVTEALNDQLSRLGNDFEAIRENLRALGLEDRALVLQLRATRIAPGMIVDIVFVDPPYRLEREYEETLELLGAKPPKLAIVTCGGPFDAATGHYLDNVIVWATPQA